MTIYFLITNFGIWKLFFVEKYCKSFPFCFLSKFLSQCFLFLVLSFSYCFSVFSVAEHIVISNFSCKCVWRM